MHTRKNAARKNSRDGHRIRSLKRSRKCYGEASLSMTLTPKKCTSSSIAQPPSNNSSHIHHVIDIMIALLKNMSPDTATCVPLPEPKPSGTLCAGQVITNHVIGVLSQGELYDPAHR